MIIEIIDSSLLVLDKETDMYSTKTTYQICCEGHYDDMICRYFKLSTKQYQEITKRHNAILIHSIIDEHYYGIENSYNSYFYNKEDCEATLQDLLDILESYKLINKLIK